MHASAQRLYEAALKTIGTAAPSAVARALNESPQTMKNWEQRGVSAGGAIKAAEAFGCTAQWIAKGGEASHQQMMTREPEAHYLNLQPFTVPQELSWEDVMQMDELPATFVLAMPDDALAPRVLRGTRLIFDTAARPQPGTGVLVRDAVGRRYVRRYAEGTGGTWLAQAVHDAYATLESARDGLMLLAVMTGRMDGAI